MRERKNGRKEGRKEERKKTRKKERYEKKRKTHPCFVNMMEKFNLNSKQKSIGKRIGKKSIKVILIFRISVKIEKNVICILNIYSFKTKQNKVNHKLKVNQVLNHTLFLRFFVYHNFYV